MPPTYLFNSIKGSKPSEIEVKDWAGVYFAYLDPSANYLRAWFRSIGKPWGVYYEWKDPTPLEEADHFAGYFGGNYGKPLGAPSPLPPAIHFMQVPTNWQTALTHLGEFIARFTEVYGKLPVFETNLVTWNAMHDYEIPSLILDCPLWFWGDPIKMSPLQIPSLLSRDDKTIQFPGTPDDLKSWAEDYLLPATTPPTPEPEPEPGPDPEVPPMPAKRRLFKVSFVCAGGAGNSYNVIAQDDVEAREKAIALEEISWQHADFEKEADDEIIYAEIELICYIDG